ncbi:MAG TPA: RNA 2',3'-cyclic phosphodiesterase [Candidatus Angelobacter sp.]|nr:RNA 2',3'-cyclic phosphodiesterase [Candidatus Angelobacter sp.]
MRIFIALDIPADIRSRLAEYMERARKLAPNARWARVEGLHVTLKFVGEFNDARLEEMKAALATVKAAPFDVKFEGVGFFPDPKAARVFWAAVDGGEPLPRLASAIDAALAGLSIARETKPYRSHLTLARTSSRPLRELQALLTDPSPQFGTMSAREFFLYQSQPQKGGSKYTKLERFGLE